MVQIVTTEGTSDVAPPPDLASLMLTAMSLGTSDLHLDNIATDYPLQARPLPMSHRLLVVNMRKATLTRLPFTRRIALLLGSTLHQCPRVMPTSTF